MKIKDTYLSHVNSVILIPSLFETVLKNIHLNENNKFN